MKTKKTFVQLVFEASTNDKKFVDVFERIQTDAYLKEKLITCETYWKWEGKKILSRCKLIFNDLDEPGYRDLWKLLGKDTTSYSKIGECNLNLSLF